MKFLPDAISVLLFSLLLECVLVVLRVCLPSSFTWRREALLQAEIRKLLREADALNRPDTFSRSARLSRQAAAKEKELNELRSHPSAVWWPAARLLLPRVLQALSFIVVTWVFTSRPVVVLPARMVWPVGWLLAFPHSAKWYGGGAVSASSWMVLCSWVTNSLVTYVSTGLGIAPGGLHGPTRTQQHAW